MRPQVLRLDAMRNAAPARPVAQARAKGSLLRRLS
jgi:hypothetical protein